MVRFADDDLTEPGRPRKQDPSIYRPAVHLGIDASDGQAILPTEQDGDIGSHRVPNPDHRIPGTIVNSDQVQHRMVSRPENGVVFGSPDNVCLIRRNETCITPLHGFMGSSYCLPARDNLDGSDPPRGCCANVNCATPPRPHRAAKRGGRSRPPPISRIGHADPGAWDRN